MPCLSARVVDDFSAVVERPLLAEGVSRHVTLRDKRAATGRLTQEATNNPSPETHEAGGAWPNISASPS